MDEPDDAELIARCRAGEESAWRLLVQRYRRLIYTVPRRAGLAEPEAADAFQRTFQRLYENLDALREPARVRAWLVTTARRETLRLLAQANAETGPAGLDELPDPGPLPDELLDGLQQQHRVRAAVARLDPASRRFIELVFLRDEAPAYEAVAAELGIAVGSIGPTRARCLAKLRRLLDETA